MIKIKKTCTFSSTGEARIRNIHKYLVNHPFDRKPNQIRNNQHNLNDFILSQEWTGKFAMDIQSFFIIYSAKLEVSLKQCWNAVPSRYAIPADHTRPAKNIVDFAYIRKQWAGARCSKNKHSVIFLPRQHAIWKVKQLAGNSVCHWDQPFTRNRPMGKRALLFWTILFDIADGHIVLGSWRWYRNEQK